MSMAKVMWTDGGDVEPWPGGEPDDEYDLGWCDYFLGVGTCTFGCQEEPACHTDHPGKVGWAVERGGFDGLWTFAFAYWWALRAMVHDEERKAAWESVQRFMERRP